MEIEILVICATDERDLNIQKFLDIMIRRLCMYLLVVWLSNWHWEVFLMTL